MLTRFKNYKYVLLTHQFSLFLAKNMGRHCVIIIKLECRSLQKHDLTYCELSESEVCAYIKCTS